MPFSTSYFLPFATTQEPKTAPDTPTGAPTGAPTGTPTGPGATGATGSATPDKPAGPACGDSTMLLYLGLFLALMYFMVMRPEQKRKKEQQAMLSAVKQGDRVVTQGGMHGVVASLTEKTVTLRVDNTKITFDRMAIARVVRDEPATGEAPRA